MSIMSLFFDGSQKNVMEELSAKYTVKRFVGHNIDLISAHTLLTKVSVCRKLYIDFKI